MEQDPLPKERDFDPFNGDLDAQDAWRHFGGLTVEQARVKFLDNPDYFQEDFMFMGGKAFAYYFPVIEDYLKSVPDNSDDPDAIARILSLCINVHFQGAHLPHVRHLMSRVIALADYVQGHLNRFGCYDEERNQVAEAWSDLVRHLLSAKN
jgi:hypothetical protein